MNEEMRLLLKLMIAQEEEEENKQTKSKRRKLPEPDEGIDFDPSKKKNRQKDVQKQYIEKDVTPEVRDGYQTHESTLLRKREVPIWEKYALTATEASQYFHMSYRKIREIINRDKYADFLIWNGGRVYIKRKMFEEFLDKSNSV